MKHLLPFILILTLVACKTDKPTDVAQDEANTKEIIELENKLAQLELENSQKDSVINEAISFFNKIQINLLKINHKEEEIKLKSTNPEFTNDDQEWILQEIQNINFLREENARNVKNLKSQLASQNVNIKELNSMIDRLVVEIKDKNKEIETLKIQLADLNMEYAELFDEYQDQVELALDVMKEMNTVYFVYGTINELTENQVLKKEGGFIGIGRKTNMAEDLNQDYFQELDKSKVKELTIVGKKPEIVTDHPHGSYEWEDNKLIILDANKFWQISNYLVVKVK